MSAVANSNPTTNPYLALKLSQAMFHKTPDSLEPEERQRVEKVVVRQVEIERRILSAPEAVGVVLPPSSIDEAFNEVQSRYESGAAFDQAIKRVGLDRDRLRASIERSLRVDAVLDRVSSTAVVNDTEIELFYLLHRERFVKPESRTLRHILVTINDSLEGNQRATARRRIDNVVRQLLKSPERFEELAARFSECTTALNGGLIGTVQSGQLYPELEREAFKLTVGQISRVVESEMGFHILQCVAIEPVSNLTLAQASGKIREHLEDSKRKALQKEWVESLLAKVR